MRPKPQKKTLLSSAVLGMLALSSLAQADDSITLGTPTYGGDGCPAGTVSSTVSPNGQALSILFDAFVAEAGGNTGVGSARRSCNVAIPVHVPNGYSVSIFAIDYRGFANVPAGGSSQFKVEYFFAGRQGPSYSKTFSGGTSSDFTLSNQLRAEHIAWSACGEDVILRTNASILVQSNRFNEQASTSIDSIDVGSGVEYHVQYQRCGGPTPPPPPVEQDRNITGNIDEVTLISGNRTQINGWACAKTSSSPIDVHLYLGGQAGQGEYAGSTRADDASEDAVAQVCASNGRAHRFHMILSEAETRRFSGKTVFVHGISPFGLGNLTIGRSGDFRIPTLSQNEDREIKGYIDGVYVDPAGRGTIIRGWACARTYSGSIDVHLYLNGAAGAGQYLTATTAYEPSESAISQICASSGSAHRFTFLIDPNTSRQFSGQTVFVHGINPFGLGNLTLQNSGAYRMP